MAANRIAFALETLQALIDADSIITVRKRWAVPTIAANTASAYIFHAGATFGEVYEDGRTETGVMSFVVAIDMKKPSDPSATGSNDAAYADLVYRVEKLIAQSTWPKSNTDSTFKVQLQNVRVAAIDGHVDDSGDSIKFGMALEIPFLQVTT